MSATTKLPETWGVPRGQGADSSQVREALEQGQGKRSLSGDFHLSVANSPLGRQRKAESS